MVHSSHITNGEQEYKMLVPEVTMQLDNTIARSLRVQSNIVYKLKPGLLFLRWDVVATGCNFEQIKRGHHGTTRKIYKLVP
jgi:hypothetical protein